MIRKFVETQGGTGRLTFIPELDEETNELKAVYPPNLPPNVRLRHEWNDGKLTVLSEIDPNYQEPAPPPGPQAPTFQPVPPANKLMDWKKEDLLTRAAEIGLEVGKDFKLDDTKAVIVARMIPAWVKHNEELAKQPQR